MQSSKVNPDEPLETLRLSMESLLGFLICELDLLRRFQIWR